MPLHVTCFPSLSIFHSFEVVCAIVDAQILLCRTANFTFRWHRQVTFFLSLFPSSLSPHYHTASMLTVQQGRSLSMPGIYTRGTPARPRHGSSSGSPLKFPSVCATFHQSLDPSIACIVLCSLYHHLTHL